MTYYCADSSELFFLRLFKILLFSEGEEFW